MRLLDTLLGSARFNPDTPSGASVLMTTFGTPDSERILPTYLNGVQAYGNSGAVFGVILARIMLFSEAEFKFQRLADKTLFGSPALTKLEQPWPGGTTGELLARMEQDVSLAGNAYVRDTGTGLERLRPDWVTIVSEVGTDALGSHVRKVVGYLYEPASTEGRPAEFYPVDEVAHWSPIPDPLAAFRGMSWLTPVLRDVDADQGLTDYKRAFLNNAATPNLLVRYKQRVGQQALDRLSTQLHARHGGVDNAFKTLVLDEGADTTVIGSSFDSMTFTQVEAAGENRIAVAAGVPAIVAGLKEGLQAATYSNYEQAMRRFADLYGRPHWRSACASLAKLVAVPEGTRLWYDTTGIAALRQGDKELADTLSVQATAAETLIRAGFKPDTVLAAITSGDMSLLSHTGLVSVQMQTPGSSSTPAAAPSPTQDPTP